MRAPRSRTELMIALEMNDCCLDLYHQSPRDFADLVRNMLLIERARMLAELAIADASAKSRRDDGG